MKTISLPKKFLVEEVEKDTKAKIVIEPCFPGYGLTLGNALRRVLLSSLAGGAVSAVRIKGVQHEFSAIENVSEDVVDIILNLKHLKVKVYTDEPVTLHLKARGEKKATGADIEKNADAEVMSKDLVIATLNDKDAELDMEIVVEKGIGYVPTEERGKDKAEIGYILVDSVYTPVLSVGLELEETRVGKKTDYDKITLNIETDGTVSPEEAVKKAAEILTNQFSWIMEGGAKEIEEIDVEAEVILPEKPEEPEAEAVKEEAAEAEVAAEEPEATEATEEEAPKAKKRGRPKKDAE